MFETALTAVLIWLFYYWVMTHLDGSGKQGRGHRSF
jgi:hypothetical protein